MMMAKKRKAFHSPETPPSVRNNDVEKAQSLPLLREPTQCTMSENNRRRNVAYIKKSVSKNDNVFNLVLKYSINYFRGRWRGGTILVLYYRRDSKSCNITRSIRSAVDLYQCPRRLNKKQ